MKKKFSQGEWTSKRTLIKCNGELVAYTATLIDRVDETRLDGESWLDMRHRTNAERLACSEEEMANAKLIAAAPSLLEALISLYESLPDGYASECLPMVRKAIKKATE